MEKQKTAGRVKEWHMFAISFIAFGVFLGIAYGVGKGIYWVLEKVFS